MPGYKAFKDHLTVMLGGNVSGYKLKPLLNYRSENPRAFKNISKATLPVHYRANKKAWLTLALFEDWFMNCFIPEVKSYFLEKGIPFQILFILDNAPGHPQYLNYLNSDVKVVFLPPNTTSILQPMDQGAIAAFKAYYLRNSFAKAVTATECENGKTLPEFWKDYNILHCIRNIAAGWEEVTPQCMNGIWKKILKRFVNCFEGFEKEKELEDISNNIVQLAKEVDLEMDNEDIHQLVEDVGDELSNEDLMQLEVERVAEEERLTAQEEEEAAPKNFVMKEIAAAFSKINEGMQMFEKMDPNVAKFAKVDCLIQDALDCYQMFEKMDPNVARFSKGVAVEEDDNEEGVASTDTLPASQEDCLSLVPVPPSQDVTQGLDKAGEGPSDRHNTFPVFHDFSEIITDG
nr:tigger transposable element-derived protein 1-like [Pelodiscus sinensis]|eukprot:XP_014429517.1 tigger transposable element-derived protein 1-like [Pelodiscus sinensis]